jgi:hypothetical protein
MMRALYICAALAALTACGVEGAPTAPVAKQQGLVISGEAKFGLAQNGTK